VKNIKINHIDVTVTPHDFLEGGTIRGAMTEAVELSKAMDCDVIVHEGSKTETVNYRKVSDSFKNHIEVMANKNKKPFTGEFKITQIK